jgi:hypothetical protein
MSALGDGDDDPPTDEADESDCREVSVDRLIPRAAARSGVASSTRR